MREMNIVAMSSGMLSGTAPAALLNDYILSLTNPERPRVCFIPTASHDSAEAVVTFYETFPADRFMPSHLTLFNRVIEDLRSFLLSQDIICVAGGNTANMLAIWRLHGVDAVLREAWQQGTVLCGWSAGALCWFDAGSTDSFGRGLAPMDDCLGFLPGSFCPHYDSEELRRPTYHRFIAEGLLPAGWACDDGTALHYEGTNLRRIVSARPGARVYRVEMIDGDVRETSVDTEPIWRREGLGVPGDTR